MTDNRDERITELELRFMHHEKTIQELNDTVYCQEQVIVRLERQVTMLTEQMRSFAPLAAGGQEQDERPPHY